MLMPNKLENKDFLSSLDMSTKEILHILELAKSLKNKGLLKSDWQFQYINAEVMM